MQVSKHAYIRIKHLQLMPTLQATFATPQVICPAFPRSLLSTNMYVCVCDHTQTKLTLLWPFMLGWLLSSFVSIWVHCAFVRAIAITYAASNTNKLLSLSQQYIWTCVSKCYKCIYSISTASIWYLQSIVVAFVFCCNEI